MTKEQQKPSAERVREIREHAHQEAEEFYKANGFIAAGEELLTWYLIRDIAKTIAQQHFGIPKALDAETAPKKGPSREEFFEAFENWLIAPPDEEDPEHRYNGFQWAYNYLSPYFSPQAVEDELDADLRVVKAFEAHDKLFTVHEDLKDKHWKLGMALQAERALADKLAEALKEIQILNEGFQEDFCERAPGVAFRALALHEAARKGT